MSEPFTLSFDGLWDGDRVVDELVGRILGQQVAWTNMDGVPDGTATIVEIRTGYGLVLVLDNGATIECGEVDNA